MTTTVASAIRPSLRDRQQSGSPHTPSRYISSVQSSPGSSFLRPEEDPIIIELDPRGLNAGFQGESGPHCTFSFTPQNSRRIGDYQAYLPGYKRRRADLQARSREYELWRSDLSDVDLGLLEDKLERAVREAYNKHLLVDAGAARLILVLPSLVPHPVLSTILTLFFERWKYSSITLLPAPAMTIAAAGLRSGLVIDLGWEETVITAIYEYREVQVRRSTRAMKALTLKIGQLLDAVREKQDVQVRDSLLLDFDFVEEFIDRAGACHAMVMDVDEDLAARTATLQVQQQSTSSPRDENGAKLVIDWPTETSYRSIAVPREALHLACIEAIVGTKDETSSDDHEQSVSQLLYRTLLSLSSDVRGVCIPRIVFSGRATSVAGLSQCILDTTNAIISQHGWTAVRGKHLPTTRSGLGELAQGKAAPADARHDLHPPGMDDFVEERLYKQKAKDTQPAVPVVFRQVESLGPWTGASLIASLKAKSFVEVDREKFLSHGLAGAHRDFESNLASQRLGPARGSERTSWTLAGWG
ncbi:hypothetical protein A1O3_03672 [Capronia epimyces CBS 606.96]|uniref:Actin-like ATPase domain-containing protein n=1 Tax=Capronia epimyces CBS 606.96 TaxID=1182542 RepID=W9YWQ7_9EURO|nr:uncharacterized protein A1O3_03672 [Capronia epimyces CBS 606.96]EXJ86719.1 hypothetical protein A1O3_03672 [Capronia epimyces CBS 606.96]